MSNVAVNGTTLAYIEKGAGETVLFVHGGSGDYRVWSDVLESFAKRYRAIALSCRHYYPNPRLTEGSTLGLEQHVADLAAFLRALKRVPAHVIGHSSPGGFGSLLLARQQPELLKSLVLIEPPVMPLLGLSLPPKAVEMFKLLLRDPKTFLAVVEFGARGIGPASKAFERGDDELGLKLFLTANLGKEEVARLTQQTLRRMLENLGPLKAQLRAGFPSFTARDARAISVPTLLVTGEKSKRVLRAISDRLQALIPNVARVEIPGATHLIFRDNPVDFSEAVLRFLATHDADPRGAEPLPLRSHS